MEETESNAQTIPFTDETENIWSSTGTDWENPTDFAGATIDHHNVLNSFILNTNTFTLRCSSMYLGDLSFHITITNISSISSILTWIKFENYR